MYLLNPVGYENMKSSGTVVYVPKCDQAVCPEDLLEIFILEFLVQHAANGYRSDGSSEFKSRDCEDLSWSDA
jgi:hypothetical protein